jgi:preprotein translocase subunit SecF
MKPFSVVAWRKVWFTISGVTIALSIAALAVWGLRQGIEFTGGSLLVMRFANRPAPAEAAAELQKTKDVTVGSVIAQPVGETDLQFRLRSLDGNESRAVVEHMKGVYASSTELRFDAIGPVLGEELRTKSIQGLIVILLAILAYVAFAFRKVSYPVKAWKYGLVTLFAAFHDVIIPLGVFAVLGHFYGLEIGTPFIAAILTVMGYSITDTIVVVDRVRENLQKMSGTFESIVDASIRQTFLRSFNTSVTTLLTLIAIVLFGGSSLHEFTLALIIGIAVGTYSSIFFASPLLVTMDKWAREGKKK